MVYMAKFGPHVRLGAIARPAARRAWQAGGPDPGRTYKLIARPIARVWGEDWNALKRPRQRWRATPASLEAMRRITFALDDAHFDKLPYADMLMIAWLLERKAPRIPLSLILGDSAVEDVVDPLRAMKPVEVIDLRTERDFLRTFAGMTWDRVQVLHELFQEYMALLDLATVPPVRSWWSHRRQPNRLRVAIATWPPAFDLEHAITCIEATGLADRRALLRFDRIQTIFLAAFGALEPEPGPGDAPTLGGHEPAALAPCLGGALAARPRQRSSSRFARIAART